MFVSSGFLVLLLALGCAKAQTPTNINCVFLLTGTAPNQVYNCQINNVILTNNENQEITIGGTHIAGHSNDDVAVLSISSSQTHFIISQVFTTFPNLVSFNVNGGGLNRIQSHAFVNARNLLTINIQNNPLLSSLPANAFMGASHVTNLNLANNALTTVHEDAFVGLNSIDLLMLMTNQLTFLPPETFRPLIRLRTIFLTNNQIGRWDGRIFSNNRQMHQISAQNTGINAIERTFLDNIGVAAVFNFAQNNCVDTIWLFTSQEVVRQGLSVCFSNFDITPTSLESQPIKLEDKFEAIELEDKLENIKLEDNLKWIGPF